MALIQTRNLSMSVVKRKASSSPSRLTAHASAYHSSVTLFDLEDGGTVLRRSKRIKATATVSVDPTTGEEEVIPAVSIVSRSAMLAQETSSTLRPTGSEKPPKSPRKPKVIRQSLDVPHPAPPRWRETYDIIKEMRSRIIAPVDTMGCDQAQLKESEPKCQRFATLVSLMLSSQTKDEVTDAAVSKLREAVGGSLTVDAIIAADEGTVSEAIAKVGFWRRKTLYLKQAALRLRDEFDSDVPKTVDELCSLPGVGPKMAFLALQVAWNLNHGIGVDVHVHRISNRLGWHQPPSKNPEETRLNLQSWLPVELHPEINHLLVGFGQVICVPVGPRCDSCDLSSKRLCPSARKMKSRSKGKTLTTQTDHNGAGPDIEIKFETEVEISEEISSPANAAIKDETA